MITAGVSGLAALVLTLAAWPWALPTLRRWRFRQSVREQGPERHQQKAGTPTMGGLVFIPAAALAAWAPQARSLALTAALVVMLGNAALGFADDFIKSALGRPLGLRAREKLLGQVVLGLALGLVARDVLDLGTWVAIPFTHLRLDLGVYYVPFVILLVLATVNATNLTDGLDGLLGGSAALVALGFAVIALAEADGALAGFGLALAGACAGFLCVNWHPARVFMGDTGSLAIGSGLAAVCLLLNLDLLLPVLGGLFVLETLSVIIQVVSFRRFGRRVFRMAPVHHHFELLGWPETTVITRFWVLAGLFAALGLGIFYGEYLTMVHIA